MQKCYDCGKHKRHKSFRASDRGRCKACSNWENNQRKRRNSYGITTGYIPYHQWLEVCKTFHNRCCACGQYRKHLTIDHIKPYSKGGTHTLDNIQPLCYSCNSRKKDFEFDFRLYAVAKEYLWCNLPHAIAARRLILRMPLLALKLGAFL